MWPENAIDIDPKLYPDVARDIAELTVKTKTPLIAGVVLNQNGVPANASVMYSIGGEVASSYVKRGLTPFGEYMPLRKLAEFFSPYAASVVDFQSGYTLQTHKVAGVDLGPIICYEIINDRLVDEMSSKSEALILQTNSATFSGTPESRQQLAISRIRAKENSRSILSVSTIGISAFIDNNGRVLSATDENIQSSLVGQLLLNHELTPANKWCIPSKLIVLALFLGIGVIEIRRQRSK